MRSKKAKRFAGVIALVAGSTMAHAQFLDNSEAGHNPAQPGGLEGYWGGFNTCNSRKLEGWVWFVSISKSPRGHLVRGTALANTQTWDLAYESIPIDENTFVFTPIEVGQVWDGRLHEGFISLQNRGVCNIRLMRLQDLPSGVEIK